MSLSIPMRLLVSAVLSTAHPVLAQSAAAPVMAANTYRLDDSGTVVIDPVLKMEWQPHSRSSSSSLVSASTKVSVQLNLAGWMGRSGRIFMTLPRTAGPTVRASWKTGGTLLPGTMLSGGRALVHTNTITKPFLSELIELDLKVDVARLIQPEALVFGFEIEVDR